MVYDGGISVVLNNKLTYKFKVGKYLDKNTKGEEDDKIVLKILCNMINEYFLVRREIK